MNALIVAIAALLFCCAQGTIQAQTNFAVITNAADVLALTPDQASNKIPVMVRGVVTAAETTWNGQFILQDETGGIFVESRSEAQPVPGDVLEVQGITQPGDFAPVISKPTWTIVGTAPLPKAKRVSFEQLMSGLEDQQRVEITGLVRAATARWGNSGLDFEIASGGYRIHVIGRRPPNITDPQTYVGARVRVRGTVTASFNRRLRQLMFVVMFVPMTNDFIVEQREASNPFDKPPIPLRATAQYRRDIQPGQRVHVRGVVTLQRPGEDFFLEDETGGLRVQSHQLDNLSVGDVVDAVGFPDFEHLMPVLDDALFRKTSEKRSPAAPKAVTIGQVTNGLHHADLVTLQGQLEERTVRSSQTPFRQSTVELLLRSEGILFSAEAQAYEADPRLTSIPIGSTIEVTGVCFTQFGDDKRVNMIQMFVPDPRDIQVLRTPSWFTPQRLLVGVGILIVVLMVALSWSVTVSKKNLALNGLIRDRERAQLELQQAHDQLEERVKERTTQLKFQITARKESELQFRATLQERTRLAQELHDTVEQTLTGIALQLDTTSKLFEARPEGASHHLELARTLVSQSQVDVRRSVWDLRSRALEQFDLPGALLASGKQLTDGTEIRFEVYAKGRVRPLSETVEENLLRVAQEAVTNVIKHSEATMVTVELDYGAQNVVLEVKDNGRGFDRDNSAGPREGHFGLLGISERAKRLGGELAVTSEIGQGTTVRIQVPIEQNSTAPEFNASEAVV